MDCFTLDIDIKTFRRSRPIWNEQYFNDPWKFGYVATLIKEAQPATKEIWEAYYYASGMYRIDILSDIETSFKKKLINIKLSRTERTSIPLNLRRLNTHFGRTHLFCNAMGERFYQHIQEFSSLEESCRIVKYRIIGETWNGILRERLTVDTLKKQFGFLSFQSVSGEEDYQLGIDYQIFCEGKLLGAIQIKPESFLSHKKDIDKARKSLLRKHERYNRETGKPVWFVFSSQHGEVVKADEFYQYFK